MIKGRQRSLEQNSERIMDRLGGKRESGHGRVRAWEKGPRQGEEDLFVFPLGLDVLVMLARRPQTMAEIL